MERRDWLRIIDANLNRAREAVRVVEDILRLGDPERPGSVWLMRTLRHRIGGLPDTLGMGGAELLAARDIQGDPEAAAPSAAVPTTDADATAVLARNFGRAAEALRAIEEAVRALGVEPGAAANIRTKLYGAEQIALQPDLPRARLLEARLCVLLDPEATDRPLPELAAGLAAREMPMLQVRCKRGSDAARAETIAAVVKAANHTATLVIVNDRADLAGATGAHGVHLGLDDLSVPEARRLLGGRAIIGATAHTPDEARAAVAAGADYLGYGTVFPSPLKPERPACGPDAAAAVAAESAVPVFAIGGITLDNIAQCRAAGVDRVAVASAVGRAADPAAAVAAFLKALQ